MLDLESLNLTELSRSMNHYIITGTTPKDSKRLNSNIRCSVAAKDIDTAIKLARAKYPEIIIYGVGYQGRIEILE